MRLGFWWTNFGNFLNKILGFVRTNLRLIIVGDSNISDLFILADKTVALFRRIFVDGNFQSIFINHYAIQTEKNREKIFATNVLILMMKILGIVTVIFCLISPILVKLFHQNSVNEKILLKFILFLSPLIILIFLMSFFISILNANGRFKISGLAPNIGNIVYVLIFYLVAKNMWHLELGNTLVFGALSYAFFQVLFMFFFAKKYFGTYDPKIDTKFASDVTKGISVNLIVPFSEVFVGVVASFYGSGIFSQIEYGHKYIYALFVIIAVPISTAIIPSLAKKNATNEKEKFSEESIHAFLLTHILCIPFVFLLYFFTENIASVFMKNISTVSDKIAMAKTISIISISLYFLMQNRILNTINNSAGQLKITLNGAIIYGLVTIIFSLILPKIMPFGLAWAGNFAYFFQFGYLLFFNLKKKNLNFRIKEYFVLISSIILGFFVNLFTTFYVKMIPSLLPQKEMIFFGINFLKIFFYIFPLALLYLIYLSFFWKYVKKLFFEI